MRSIRRPISLGRASRSSSTIYCDFPAKAGAIPQWAPAFAGVVEFLVVALVTGRP
jgi:hypothetical protein